MPDESLWMTAKELCESTPEMPDYAIDEIMVLGAITELTAFIKAGKTTFMGQSLRSMFAGEEFIGLKVNPSPVLYLTEEGKNTFRSMVTKAGLVEEERLHILHRGSVWRMPWKEIIGGVVIPKLQECGARYVVVDTLTKWAGVKGDEENQTGAAQEAMEPLEMLRDVMGVGVMVVRHGRKSGGEIGESARGASAWGGAADVLLTLQKPDTHGHPNRRVVESLGRFHDAGKWTIDLIQGRYHLVSRGETAERESAKEFLVSMKGSGMVYTLKELCDVTRTAETTMNRALDELIPAGFIRVEGAGKKGDPRRYVF